jgi:hypothetical protein
MPATTTLSRKILVFPSPTPAGLKLEGHVSDVHFTVSHRQPKLIAIDKQPDDAAAQPLSQKTSRYSPGNSPAIFIRGGELWLMHYCWRIYFKVLEVLFLASVSQAFLPSKKACEIHKFGTFEFANSIRPLNETSFCGAAVCN